MMRQDVGVDDGMPFPIIEKSEYGGKKPLVPALPNVKGLYEMSLDRYGDSESESKLSKALVPVPNLAEGSTDEDTSGHFFNGYMARIAELQKLTKGLGAELDNIANSDDEGEKKKR